MAALGASFGDGSHLVGKDLLAGIYRTNGGTGQSGICEWSQLRGLSGNYTDRIASGSGYREPQIIKIEASDAAFFTVGCGTWQVLSLGSREFFGDGAYLVGSELQAGTYRTDGGDGVERICQWTRLKGLSGAFLDQAGVGSGYRKPQLITISTGDAAFVSAGCGVWRMVP